MPMVYGPSGSTSPMASTSANIHHDQMTAHYHQYNTYDAAREAAIPSIASSSRQTVSLQQPIIQDFDVNGRTRPGEQQQQSWATSTASSSLAVPSATSSPHYSNSDKSQSNVLAASTSSQSVRSPSTTPSPSLALPQSSSITSSAMPTTAASLMREGPRDFTVIKDVGDGSFGTVCLADWKSPLPSGTLLSPMQHPTTRPEYLGKRLVAIKKMKKPFPNWEECIKLKELKCLLAIPHHPNIIPLYDAFLMPTTKELHFVFECMEGNLYQLTKSRRGRPLAGGLVGSIFQQIVKGLHHIHQEGYFHRDMKPENLLITTTGLADYPSYSSNSVATSTTEKDVLVIVKLADFGLARETNSKPPYTEYVSTRWYRAPEVLLRSRDYSNPVDMWALGTILAELVNLKPLFPGQSEVDQVMQICEILGDPSSDYGRDERGRLRGGGSWNRGIQMASGVGFAFPKVQPIAFSSLFGSKIPVSLVECIQDLLRYEPKARLTTQDCLDHPYYQKVAPRMQPPQAKAVVAATTLEEQVALGRSNAKATAMNSIGSVMDQRAQRSALPPSHSMIPQSAKPAFGESVSQADQDMDVQMEVASPLAKTINEHGQAPTIYHGNYQAPSQIVESKTNAQYYAAAQRRGQGDDMELGQGHNGIATQQSNIAPTATHLEAPSNVYKQANPSFLAESGYGREGEYDVLTAKEKEKRKSKGWISSVLSGNSAATNSANLNRKQTEMTQAQVSESSSGQTLGVEATVAIAAPLMDPKKAKKLAEKAAREAEKSKRAAQEQAARDRARAVMQKRNQMLGDTSSRDQVEWLSLADNKTIQGPTSFDPALSSLHSEISKGKQPAMQASSSEQFDRQSTVNGRPNFASQSNSLNDLTWQPQLSSPRSKVRRREFDDESMAPNRNYFVGSHLPLRNARRMSIQSFQTGDSDPGPNRNLALGAGLHLMHHHESTSSLNSAPGQIDGTSSSRTRFGDHNSFDTRSIASSLDHQLIQNMENMTAAESISRNRGGSTSPGPVHLVGQRPSYSRQSHGSRTSSAQRQGSASPLHHQAPPRFHPYTIGSNAINGNAAAIQQPTSANSPYGFNLPSLASITQSGGKVDYVESLHTGGVLLGARPKSLPRRSSHNAHRGTASRGNSMASGEGPFLRQHPGSVNPMFNVPSGHQVKALSPPPPHSIPSIHSPQIIEANGNTGGSRLSPNSQQLVLPPFSQLAAAAASSDRNDDLYTLGEASSSSSSSSSSPQQHRSN